MAVTSKKMNQKKASYLLVILFMLVVFIITLFISRQMNKQYSIHSISGESMIPTLMDGEKVLIKKCVPVKRYDMIAFSLAKEKGLFVKRVIGLPGDAMIIQNNRLILNLGEPADFETVSEFQLTPTIAAEFQPLNQIPEDVYFVVGDHLAVSKDSRTFGFVQKKAIKGKVQAHFAKF